MTEDLKPRDRFLKKNDMEWLYSTKENPWEYSDNHFECYLKLFESIKSLLPTDLKVLELGSGEGYFAEKFISYFKSDIKTYTGTDISKIASESFINKLATTGITISSLSEFDFEDVLCLEKYRKEISESNLIIAVESLYLSDSPTGVLRKVDKYITPGSRLLICDSNRRFIVREYPHRRLNYELVTKVVNPLYVDKKGSLRKLTSFLTIKR